MTYDELVAALVPNMVITFREFALDRHERKHVSVSYENAIVHEIVPPGMLLSREKLVAWYGEGLSDTDYLQLSKQHDLRLALNMGLDQYGQMIIRPITVNRTYFNAGLQSIEFGGTVETQEEPIYMAAMLQSPLMEVSYDPDSSNF